MLQTNFFCLNGKVSSKPLISTIKFCSLSNDIMTIDQSLLNNLIKLAVLWSLIMTVPSYNFLIATVGRIILSL